MRRYIKPVIEKIEIEAVDVIQTSRTLINGGVEGNFSGGGAGAGWGSTTASVYDNQ